MSETSVIADLVASIRDGERVFAKKYPFGEKYLTYWDADDFLLHVKLLKIPEVVLLNSKFNGVTIQIYGKLRKGAVSIHPYKIIDAQFIPASMLELLFTTVDIFNGGAVSELISPNRDAMANYCRGVDGVITKAVLKTLKAHPKLKGIFLKICEEMGVGEDRLRRRVKYYYDVVTAYRDDADAFKEEIKKLGLKK